MRIKNFVSFLDGALLCPARLKCPVSALWRPDFARNQGYEDDLKGKGAQLENMKMVGEQVCVEVKVHGLLGVFPLLQSCWTFYCYGVHWDRHLLRVLLRNLPLKR